MPQSSPNPRGLQASVEHALTEGPKFIKQVTPDEVPDEIRDRLQSEFESLARHVIESEELAAGIDEAVRSEDSEQLIQLKFRSFEAVEHRIAESPNEWDFDVLN